MAIVTKSILAFLSLFFTFSLFPNTISCYHERASQSLMEKTTQHRPDINLVVAQDGSSQFRTIQDALNAAMRHRQKVKHQRINIHIRAGIYHEYLVIGIHNIYLIGEGIGQTIITGDRMVTHDTRSTEATATVTINGDKGTTFIARGITFRNTAGLPHSENNQAVALRVHGGNSAFYHCSFEGHQDTLFADSGNQLYRECTISGSMDFIFGNALAIFQRCDIIVRPSKNKKSVITANGRASQEENTGFIFQNCRIFPSDEMRPLLVSQSHQAFLGRPWKKFARTVIMNSRIEGIDAEGWLDWDVNTDNVEYVEFGNTGAGANTHRRKKWKNYKVLHHLEEARKYTLKGGFWPQFKWLKKTDVPFDRDL